METIRFLSATQPIGRVLGQVAPSDTSATSLYAVATDRVSKLTSLAVCNTTGASATYRIFIDDDGSTYDTTTALFYDKTLSANESVIHSIDWYMDDPNGNIAVRAGTAGAVTFTLFGEEIIASGR